MSSRYDVRIITTREGYNKLSQYMEDRFMEEDIYGESIKNQKDKILEKLNELYKDNSELLNAGMLDVLKRSK